MSNNNTPNTITIDDVKYVRADSVPEPQPTGTRAVVVVNKGWIFAGDVTEEDGHIYLDRAVWVFRWSEIGFNGVIANPTSPKVDIRKMPHRVDIPAHAEVFRIPVPADWGL